MQDAGHDDSIQYANNVTHMGKSSIAQTSKRRKDIVNSIENPKPSSDLKFGRLIDRAAGTRGAISSPPAISPASKKARMARAICSSADGI